MKALRLVFLLLFFAFTLISFVGNRFGLSGACELIGYTPELKDVPLRWATYSSGEFQAAYEEFFNQMLGFREPLVRADNELTLRLFHQVGLNPRTSMVLGKNDFLFERDYIEGFNRHDEVSTAELEAKVQRLALLQKYLQSRGSNLLLVISPSKPLVYPEYLPPEIIVKERQSVPTNYEKFVPLLERYGIQYVNGEAYIESRKGSVPFTFFSNSGTHWNDPASCEVAAEVIGRIAVLTNRPLPGLRCQPFTPTSKVRKRDIDILQLANLWWEPRLYQTVYHAHPRLRSRIAVAPPNMLVVGSSFYFNMDDYVRMYHIERWIYRYFAVEHGHGGRRPVDRKNLDWEANVFSKNLVLMEINAGVVQNIGWGFLEEAERVIKARGGVPN